MGWPIVAYVHITCLIYSATCQGDKEQDNGDIAEACFSLHSYTTQFKYIQYVNIPGGLSLVQYHLFLHFHYSNHSIIVNTNIDSDGVKLMFAHFLIEHESIISCFHEAEDGDGCNCIL